MDLALLEPGQTLCGIEIVLTAELRAAYLDAVEDNEGLYPEQGVVPPMAIAALVMSEAMRAVELPPGAIHTGQELTFAQAVDVGSTLLCSARVASNSLRRGTRFLALDLKGSERGESVIEGRTTLVIAEETQ